MKRNLLIAAALLWTAGTTWGQVAAPSLVPASFTSENPAAIRWGQSKIGLLAGYTSSSSNAYPYGSVSRELAVGLRM